MDRTHLFLHIPNLFPPEILAIYCMMQVHRQKGCPLWLPWTSAELNVTGLLTNAFRLFLVLKQEVNALDTASLVKSLKTTFHHREFIKVVGV